MVFQGDEFNALGLLDRLSDGEPNKGSGRATGKGTGKVPHRSTDMRNDRGLDMDDIATDNAKPQLGMKVKSCNIQLLWVNGSH